MKKIVYKRIFFLLILNIFLVNCHSDIKKAETLKENIVANRTITDESIFFFDFDEIKYYKTDFDEKKSVDLIRNNKKSKIDSLKYQVILGETPKNLTDLDFIKNLDKIGFFEEIIGEEKHSGIRNIFKEKKIQDDYAIGCAPVFRDILLFYKNKKIIGIAKICFTCQQNIIIGTNANTDFFGHNGDYKKLYTLLNKKNNS